MKINIEIKDDRFIFSYHIGENKQTSDCKITPDMLVAFTYLLDHCTKVVNHDYDEIKDKITAESWMYRNVDKAKEVINKIQEKK